MVNTKRYIIDSTNVSANVRFPFPKKLVRDAFYKVLNEIEKFNEELAKEQRESFEADIQREYDKGEKVRSKVHYEIVKRHLEEIYLKTYDELQVNKHHENVKYLESYGMCYDIADQYLNKKKDKIGSIVDPGMPGLRTNHPAMLK